MLHVIMKSMYIIRLRLMNLEDLLAEPYTCLGLSIGATVHEFLNHLQVCVYSH